MAIKNTLVKVGDGTVFAIEVSPVGNSGKWELVVYKLPERTVLTQDFYPERQFAMSRAHDFKTTLERKLAGGKMDDHHQAS